ncbi:SDR family oxidoreductase [Microbacterium invictum]|uniref:Uncharacterized protein YbjT (DUF2867 family) n=1 Tax=Microbacterium invictum TaxID=515415 RepID=A0AA40VNF9_9MICO|nr:MULTISPECIES: NAD(P)H-binding protein [Microbacterium]MBB4140852.1 uncharacterized protein YbjT (DUF2867 family) [Microbacterium invictum]
MKLAIAGGTGTVGRHVVAVARDRGHDVVVLARSQGTDVLRGEGLTTAVEGADAVIDVTNLTTLSARSARRFFETVTGNLLGAEMDAGVAHHVALSIVGIDDIDASYYAGKLAQERAVMAGSVPYSIVRVGQFHEFVGQLLSGMNGRTVVMPTMLMRPVAAREIAAHLLTVTEGGPAGRTAELVGPRDERLGDLVRMQLAYDLQRRRVLEVRLPGRYGRGLASGALRGTGRELQGEITFENWLRSDDHRR